MTRYSLSKTDLSRLKNEYPAEVREFVYGLRMLEICIEKASEAFGNALGFEQFDDWLHQLASAVDEGMGLVDCYVDTEQEDVTIGDKDETDGLWEQQRLTLPALIAQMEDDVASLLSAALDDSESGYAPAAMSDEDTERFEKIAEQVTETVLAVGWDAYHCLIGAQFHSENTGSDDGLCVDNVLYRTVLDFAELYSRLALTPDPKRQKPARHRAARADASVGTIKRKIEKTFGLPRGSISLLGPDGRSLRANALISTLRRRWKQQQGDK